ncbi:hypothetical protein AAHC03_021083 [Spirometra sp. Aus1]
MALYSFIVALTFFASGFGQDPCTWSKRIIPKDAVGNFTIEVPIHYSYWVSCYQNGERFCSGLGPAKTGAEDKCAFTEKSGRIRIGGRFFKPSTRFGYYYCYLDKGMTKALTYIVDWKNGKKTRDIPSTVTESSGRQDIPNPSTSSASIILGEITLVWLWSLLASQI